MDDARPPGEPDVPPPHPPPPPAGPPPAYGPPAYGPPAYGPPAYGPPAYGPPAYGPPVYGPPPAYRPPAPYPVPPPPPTPPPTRRSRLPLLLGVGGAAVVLLLVCGLLAGLLWAGARPDDPSPSGTDPGLVEQVAADSELARAAGTLRDSPATRYRGWFTDGAGSRYDVDARVTDAGSTVARLTSGGRSIQVVEIGERTFVKAGASYWQAAGAPAKNVAEYARRWVKVPAETFGFDLGDVLAPRQIAEAMAPGIGGEGAASSDEVRSRRGTPQTVDGVPVVPVTAGRVTYYVSRDEPRRLVRLAAGATPPSGGTVQHTRHDRRDGGFRPVAARTGDIELALSLAQLSAAEQNQLFTELKAHVTDLRAAIDAEVRFALNGAVTLAPCTTNGCTATLTLRNTVTSRSPYLSVRQVTAEVTVRMTLDGAPVATCTSTRAMKPNGTVRVSCRAGYSIPPSRNPRTHTVRAEATAMARALAEADIRQMAKDLADQIIRSRTPPARTGAEYFPKGQPPALNARQQAARNRVDQLAKRACREVKQLPGEDGTTWGSRVHRRLAQMLAGEPATSQLYSEVGYRAGGLSRRWRNPVRGTSGWIKGTRVPDVVFGTDRLRPELLLDLKTGSLGLEERWYNELVAQLPQRYKTVPVLAVRC